MDPKDRISLYLFGKLYGELSLRELYEFNLSTIPVKIDGDPVGYYVVKEGMVEKICQER